MQKDFHYYCIGVLAKAAGFSSKDALTIAYASQYVDDATEGTQIPVNAPNNIRIDPVRTAHKGLMWLLGAKWSEQKKVYIPFHFIPPLFYEPPGWGFGFITKPGSDFAKMLLKEACKGKKECKCWEPMIRDFKLFRLCRIGIALHTYADTWAHQDFSGRNDTENEVKGIYIYKKNKDKPSFQINLRKALPCTGHAEAGKLPDRAFLKWGYHSISHVDNSPRLNAEVFTEAAESIHRELSKVEKPKPESPNIPWEKIKEKIFEQFQYEGKDVDDRCDKWREFFINMFDDLDDHNKFKYNEEDWRKTALDTPKEEDYNWEDFSKTDRRWNRFTLKKEYFLSPFYHFHRAALLQRHFVLERLP
ncbi:MAG: hypothetical protein JW984_08065 [Deltaproteobacteria bacterium]|uniref:Uncharacterized protein n=1 Tax=Candidatus Zymogenus saltonus TaxID=2844893 RepID=A0A9D8KFL2_9DELT|nr:hypothetical protein [Candidatus Zymogenus saltonus]